jgi:hypothetical protein
MGLPVITRDREYKNEGCGDRGGRHMNMRSERRMYLVPLRTSDPS